MLSVYDMADASLELSIYDRLQIWAIRSQGTLGKQMYNKILNLAVEDIDRLIEIQLDIPLLDL